MRGPERRISRANAAFRVALATVAAPTALFFGARSAGAEVPTSQVTVPTVSSTTPNGIRDHVATTPTIISSSEKSSDGADPLLPLAIGTGAVLLLIATFPFSDGEGPPRRRRSDIKAEERDQAKRDLRFWEQMRDDPKFGGSMSPEVRARVFGDLDDGPSKEQ